MKTSLIITGSVLVLIGLSLLILGMTLRDEPLPSAHSIIQPGQWVFLIFLTIGSILALALLIVWTSHAT